MRKVPGVSSEDETVMLSEPCMFTPSSLHNYFYSIELQSIMVCCTWGLWRLPCTATESPCSLVHSRMNRSVIAARFVGQISIIYIHDIGL
jgi:hypothetical protein